MHIYKSVYICVYINVYISICVRVHQCKHTRMFITELFITMSKLVYICAIENNTAIQGDQAELYELT